MFPEIEKFKKHLWRQRPHTSTHRHYTSDLRLFFAWANKSLTEITISDVDAYIAYSQEQGHALATINRRLVALSAFYQFLQFNETNPPANPVIPRRHFTRRVAGCPAMSMKPGWKNCWPPLPHPATGRYF